MASAGSRRTPLASSTSPAAAPVAGPPFGRYAFNGGVGVEAGVPVAAPLPETGDLVMSSLPATEAVGPLCFAHGASSSLSSDFVSSFSGFVAFSGSSGRRTTRQ